MLKRILITVALGAVVDALLNWATEKKQEAESETARWRWDAFVTILLLLKANPEMLTNRKQVKP